MHKGKHDRIAKAKSLHNWIVNHVRFGKLNKGGNNISATDILYGRGYCDGFFTAYSLLLSKTGIANMLISRHGQGQSYMWNLVCNDEQWYHVETFDSPGRSKFFMLTNG